LASTKLAFFLIALVVLQILVSAVVPQKGLVEEQIIGMRSMLGDDNAVVRFLQLDRIFFSPFFLISLGFLMVNLLAGNLKRFRTVLRVEGTLLKARYLGSIIFHLALLMISCGVMLHSLYRFDGAFGITEGQRVLDEESQYFYITKGALSREPAGRFSLTLEDIDREYPVKDATTDAASVLLEPAAGGAPLKGMLRINQPFRWEGYEFHYGALTGFSPEVLVLDPSGEILFRRFVRMKVRKSGSEWIHADFVELPDSGTRIEVHINEVDGGQTALRRLLNITRADSTLFSGEVAAGDTVTVGDIRVAVPRVRNWCYLHAVRNPWLWLVFTGFWLGLTGLTISVLPRVIPKKERSS
jgi:cytochrome c biogenesis protein ResB